MLVARKELDPAFRQVLKDDALILIAPGGVSVEGAPHDARRLPRLTLASALERDGDVKREILQICHENLAPHKVPATVRFVPALDVAAAGKLARRDA